MVRYYTYVHYHSDEVPFYVGKGKGNRFKVAGYRNADYSEVVTKYGIENISIEIIPQESEEKAVSFETYLIEEYTRQGIKLVNIMPRGWCTSGWHHAEATKKRISNAQPLKGKLLNILQRLLKK